MPLLTHPPLHIGQITTLTKNIRTYEVAEFQIDLQATYDNPFDAGDVSLDATVTRPDGTRFAIPGFAYRSYRRSLEHGKEVLTPDGPPSWRLRLCPEKPGRYRFVMTAKDRTGTVASKPISFSATRSSGKGFIGLSKQDPHYFAFESGAPYFPVGSNTCWGNDPGTFNFDTWFSHYGANGANYGRLWLGPLWSTFALDTTTNPFGQFDLGNLWRLDYVLDLARKNGIYLMLTMDSYNTLRDKDAYPEWEKTPLNAANGGPLHAPQDYWTSPEIQEYYRNRLRYLVARYAANPHVMAWEFWNEVDLTRDFKPEVVAGWHREMGSALKTSDPYHHLVTTSFSKSQGFPEIDGLPELDYIQTHLYAKNFEEESVLLNAIKKPLKAHYVGEVGADWRGPRADDKAGIQLHDSLWTGIANGMSGTAMMWWWDNLIAPNDQYGLFKPAATFARFIDWPAEGFQPAQLSVDSPVDATGVVGKNTAIVWLRAKGWNFHDVVDLKKEPTAVSSSKVTLNNLTPGLWKASVFNPWTGESKATEISNGQVTVPPFTRDTVIKLTKD